MNELLSTQRSHTSLQQLQLVQGKPHRLVLNSTQGWALYWELSPCFRTQPAPTRHCWISLTSTKVLTAHTQTGRVCFPLSQRNMIAYRAQKVFTLRQMQKKRASYGLSPSLCSLLHTELQRSDWGRAAPISHQVSTTFLWQLLCFSHLDTNLLQKETIKVSSFWILFCSVQANTVTAWLLLLFIYIYIYIFNQPKQLQINWINRGLL